MVLGILTLSEDTTTSIVAMILGIIALVVFVLSEIKRKRKGNVPLLDVGLFKDRNLRVGTAIMLLAYIVMEGGLFAVSLYLQSVLELSAFNTGLTLLPMTVSLLIFSVAAPGLSGKLNHKVLMAIGSILAIIGCMLLSYQFKMNTTMLDLLPGMFVLGAGLGFIMALGVDIALVNIPEESENNASGITSTGQSLGESMGTAVIGIILILGVLGGISNAVDTYAPDHSGDEQYHQDIYDYFQKIGNVNEIKSQGSAVVAIVDNLLQDSMAFVMQVTAILMGVIFILTLRLQDKTIKK